MNTIDSKSIFLFALPLVLAVVILLTLFWAVAVTLHVILWLLLLSKDNVEVDEDPVPVLLGGTFSVITFWSMFLLGGYQFTQNYLRDVGAMEIFLLYVVVMGFVTLSVVWGFPLLDTVVWEICKFIGEVAVILVTVQLF